MSGFWQNLGNSNNNPLNTNFLFSNNAFQSGANPRTSSFGNDIHTARALLAASIPLAQPTFSQKSQAPRKTTSVISLPPSLANRRHGKTKEIGGATFTQTYAQTASDGSVQFNEVPAASLSSIPHVSKNSPTVNSVISGASAPHILTNPPVAQSVPPNIPSGNGSVAPGSISADSANPVFSTEISKGKPIPSSKVDDNRCMILDPLKPQQKLLPYNAQRLLYDNDFWHKFVIIGGAKLDREKILKRILEACEPTLMLPVLYQEEGEDTAFYARNCGSAVERLCRNYHLCLELDGLQIYIRVYLHSAPVHKLRVNALTLLRRVLEKRWKSDQRALDLSNFQHDAELDTFMFCPLSQPSVLHYVLHTAINHPINFSSLILSHNSIRQLRLDVLVKASYLRSLDLSHNELLYQKDLQDLKELHNITKLVLDGNPLCSEFRTPEAYVSTVKSIMPQLISLDHVPLFSGAISVTKEQNFLCTKTGYNLVDQFLKHFFDRYDWSDRRCLDGLYHENALFSLTCIQISGQSSSDSNKLTWYTSYNRNLLKLCDYSKADKLIYHGPSQILDLFCSLPATEHDPYSFCVDLIHYNDKTAVISVAGVFREHPTMPPDPDFVRAFRRVFSLSSVSHNEWQITNEQLHISNPTKRQAEVSFKLRRPPLEAPVAAWLIHDAQLLTEEEKDQMSSIMMQITTLNKQWATRFLEESHWYVREALIAFVNQYEAKTLPDEAFATSLT